MWHPLTARTQPRPAVQPSQRATRRGAGAGGDASQPAARERRMTMDFAGRGKGEEGEVLHLTLSARAASLSCSLCYVDFSAIGRLTRVTQ